MMTYTVVVRSSFLLLANVILLAGSAHERAAGSIPRLLRARKRRASSACVQGLFRASLARRALGLSRAEALSWGRHLLPYTVETLDQQQLFCQDEGVQRAWHER